jgi:hypothetical protein
VSTAKNSVGCSFYFVVERLVEDLKRKNASLEAKLRSLSICSLCAQPLKSRPQDGPSTNSSFFTPKTSHIVPTKSEHTLAEDDFSHVELADRFQKLALNPMKDKFFGSSSGFSLVSSAITVRGLSDMLTRCFTLNQVKESYLGRPAPQHLRRPLFWEILPVSHRKLITASSHCNAHAVGDRRRKQHAATIHISSK